jgi:hypothetical protein
MRPSKPKFPSASLEPRRSHRFDLRAKGELVLLSGRHACWVNEISRHGARLSTHAGIERGDDGLLQCDGLDLLFHAIRVEKNTVVVEFVDELAGSEGAIDPALAALIKNNNQILRFLDI